MPETESRPRLTALAEHFRTAYGRPATFLVRAPGRVNLLGEHTDYNGFPVLPMAIDRGICIAGARRDDRVVNVGNVAAQFAARTYTLDASIPAFPDGDWGNYSKAAAQGLMHHCGAELRGGADFLVDGNIPSGAGLSSSSALVVANALALLAANDTDIPYETLADLPAAERYVGTLSGGMDQATCLLARAGHALRIDFFPLRVHTVPLPAGYAIVVCHSLVSAEKSGGAKHQYNLRVIECRLACRVLEQALGGSLPCALRTLGDLARLFPDRPLLEFLAYPQLPERPLSLAEIATALGTHPDRLRTACGIDHDIGDQFRPLRRLRHVLTEAARVDAAERCLRAGDAAGFGHLMAASHRSCRDDYDISCPALEALVATAMQAGAVGARLTGAGFGGCTVNLVPDSEVPAFLRHVDRHFYAARLPVGVHAGSYRFIFKPQAGAGVRRL